MSSLPGANFAKINAVRTAPGLKNPEAELLNAVEVAVIATDLDGTIIYWNRFAEKLYGWTSDEVLGRGILDVTPTADSRERATEILTQLEKGESWAGEFTVRHKDGRWFAAHVTDSPMCDENGALIGIVGVSREIVPNQKNKAHNSPLLEDLIARAKNALAFVLSIRDRSAAATSARDSASTLSYRLQASARSFGTALLIFAAAVLARILLDQIVPERLPFITFFPAVLLVSLLCGPWPSVLVLLASAVTGAFWGEPADGDVVSFRIWAFTLFTVIGGANLALVLYVADVLNRLRRRDEQLALINRELKHRLKNLFAITNSICVQTIKSAASLEDIGKAIGGRIHAVASAQDLLSIEASKGSDLRALVDALVRPVSPAPSRLRIEGPAVTLPAEATTPFALILHELATNAVKHGAWAGEKGGVSIEWRAGQNRELDFRWREHDAPVTAPPVRVGLGSTLITRGLNGATVEHQIRPDGLYCRIAFAL